jgi:hypothetical protein
MHVRPHGPPDMELERPASAVYANLFRVGHNESEFVIEFCQSYTNRRSPGAEAAVVARIVVTPAGASELEVLLRDSLDRHARLVGRTCKDVDDGGRT